MEKKTKLLKLVNVSCEISYTVDNEPDNLKICIIEFINEAYTPNLVNEKRYMLLSTEKQSGIISERIFKIEGHYSFTYRPESLKITLSELLNL
jgi:hypothetical protein